MLKISVIHRRSLTVPEPISDIRAAAGLQKLKNARKIGQNTLYAQNFLYETIKRFSIENGRESVKKRYLL
jgi:hypothetical protein